MKNFIQPITQIKELLKAINFLGKSFKWSKNKSTKIQKSLIKNNKSLGVYGYSILDRDGEILGAFLLFDQTFYLDYYKKLKLINISSWYVDSKVRGLESLLMIRTFLKDYPEYIITNLSANKKAYEIFKSFGFQDSYIKNKKYTFLNFLFNYRILKKTNLIFLLKLINSKKLSLSNKNIRNNTNKELLNIDGEKLYLITSMINWEKGIGRFNIQLKCLRILWVSDPIIFKKYFYKINLFYIIKNFPIFITTHCELNNPEINSISETKQIFYPINPNYKNKNIALGSELNFI